MVYHSPNIFNIADKNIDEQSIFFCFLDYYEVRKRHQKE